MTLKRTMCALLAATMLLPTAIMAETSAAAAEVDVAESAAQLTEESSEAGSYGLRDNIQDGVILHCFDWTYNDIKAELPNIAKAGFTSVQTSPAQQACGTGAWYWAYQPLGFYIGNTFGTKAELQSLCEEAHKYGIKVIVDSIGNHLASDHTYIQDDLKDSQYYHNSGYSTSLNNVNWENRWQVTHCDVGMPDLATENSHVQQCAKKYMEELKSVGVDGIRWDTAKHIELPSEGDNFWPTVSSVGLYQYGEILKGPDDRDSGNEALMKEYTNYMSVTDSEYGSTVRNAFASGNVPGAYGNWVARGITSDKMVYWGESHDTWANAFEGDYSWNKSENVIDRAYAAVASRNQATALYYSRPLSNPQAKENTKIGEKGSTHFTSKEVAAVNHFHNAMVGKADYYTASNGCAVITRKDGGAIVVKGSGSGYVSVTNGGGYAKAGTYKDEITGNEFTVTSTTITGTIGDSGIAVIYDAVPISGLSASPDSGTSFTDTLTVTLYAANVKSASYTTSEGASGTYTDGKTITIGGSTAEGSKVTLTLTGTASDGSALSPVTYTYTKKGGYPVLDGAGFVFDNSATNWSTVNAYVYDESGSSVISNGQWPGVKMTDCGDGYWKYNLDSKFSGSNIRVIFNNGSNQIPASQQPGYQMSSSDKKLYEGGNWKDLPVPSITVSLSASPTKVTVGEPVTLTANATGASGTVNYTFSDGSNTIQSSTNNTAAWTPVAEGEYKVTVTAKDSKNATATATANVSVIKSEGPTVNVDKASGTSFTTETTSLKLTLSNASSGTYSVDDGPVKSFTGSKTITIGEGKIGDSTITVKTTATDGKTTNTKTYTYNKVYQKKTSASSGSSSKVTAASTAAIATEESSAALASQYKTNPNGVGKEKTITIDGDASDWSEDMLIAQGAAWDVANHWKGGHENCVLDAYALFAAWDNDNLYVGWQMVNTTDTWAREGDGPLSDGGRVLDVPLILALSIDPSSTSMSNKNTDSGPIWGQKMGLEFDTHVDRLLYMSGKPGLGQPSMFKAVDSKGNTNYTTGCVAFADGGIEYKMATTNICSSIIGLNNSSDPSDVTKDSADWVDYKTFSGSSGTHKTKYDSFYEIKIPFKTLGISKDYITKYGIGAMLVATRGESALDCIPFDSSMVDNALGDYTSDASTSHEKDDVDVITASFASIGNGKIIPPDSDSDSDSDTDTDDNLPLQVNFGTNKSAPQYTSTALTLKGIGYGGTAPYKYQFSVDGKVVKASNTTATYTWTPKTSGIHTISCVITDSTGKTATVTKTFTAEGDDTDIDSDSDSDSDTDIVELKNTSKVSSTSVTTGTTVTITGSATGGTKPYKYAFYYRRSADSKWTLKGTEYGTATSTTLTPGYVDTYYVLVNVMDSDGNIVPKTFTINVSKKETLTNNSTFSATTVKAGTAVTAKASASGGTSPYTYAYYWKKSTSSTWTTKKAYSTTTSVSYSFSTPGDYDLKVAVKDSTGTIVEKESPLTVTTVNPLTNSSTISATTVTPGTSFKVTAKATGGTSPYTYAYYYKKSTSSSWTTKKAYSSTASATYTINTAGTYDVKVSVKDNDGNVADKTFSVIVGQAELENNSTLSSTVVKPGTSITATASAAGGTGSYTYAFWWQKMGGSGWNTKKAYSTSKTAAYTFNTAGAYNVRISVKDSSGKIKSVTYHVYITTLTNSSTLSATSVSKGTAIKATGKSSNGSGTKQYAFYWKKSTSSTWTTKSAYGVASTATYTFNTAGTYDIRISVKDSTDAVVFKDYTVTIK